MQNMILAVFECLHFEKYPGLHSSTYSLRGGDILSVPNVN